MQSPANVGIYGVIVAFLGYMMMVRTGDAYRRNSILLSNPREPTGCILGCIGGLMMLGGVAAIIYAFINHWKTS
jgi:hypothetical protein